MIRYVLGIFGMAGLVMAQYSQFVTALGGTGWEYGYSVVQTPDNGFLVAGETNSFSSALFEVILAKFDASGNLLWTKTTRMLGSGSDGQGPCGIVLTPDGGFAITGHCSDASGGTNKFIAKYDALGNLQWSKRYGSGELGSFAPIIKTLDNGFAICGLRSTSYQFDLYISRFDASGNLLWARWVGNTSNGAYETGYDLVQTPDSGFAVVGYTNSFGAGNTDVLLCRFDKSGNLLWTKTYGGTADESGAGIARTPDGGFVIVGTTRSWGAGSSDALLLKVNSSGDLLWARTLGGADWDYGDDVIVASDGSILITGELYGYGAGDDDIFLAKFDADGSYQWTKAVGGSAYEGPYQLIQTSDAGFAITGVTYSWNAGGDPRDLILIKYDASGNTCIGGLVSPTVTSPTPTVTSPSPSTAAFTPATQTPAPITASPAPVQTLVCRALDNNESPSPTSEAWLIAKGKSIRFFLPVASQASLSVYDAAGRLVARPIHGFSEAGEHEIKFEQDGGVYIAVLNYRGRDYRVKTVVQP
jgi:hypothetical protein